MRQLPHLLKNRLLTRKPEISTAAATLICGFRHGVGGASRTRTDDPLRARQVLSQLSYGPCVTHPARRRVMKLVGLGGLEPPTSPLSGVRSDQLSYRPAAVSNRTG